MQYYPFPEAPSLRKELYSDLITQATRCFGSRRAVGRSLGLSHATLAYRLEHPATIRRENIIALEALIERTERPEEM